MNVICLYGDKSSFYRYKRDSRVWVFVPTSFSGTREERKKNYDVVFQMTQYHLVSHRSTGWHHQEMTNTSVYVMRGNAIIDQKRVPSLLMAIGGSLVLGRDISAISRPA